MAKGKQKLIDLAKGDDLRKFSYKANGKEYTIDLLKELEISDETINNSLSQYPQIYYYLSRIKVTLENEVNRYKDKEEKVYSELYIEYKDSTDETTNRAYADEKAKRMALTHKDYLKNKKLLRRSFAQLREISAILKSFEEKKASMQSISANNRKL